MRLPDLLGRRRQGDEPLDAELEQLFLQSSRVPIPEQRELLRARARVGTALAQQAPSTGRLLSRLALPAVGGGRWRTALGGSAAVAVLMVAIAFSALLSTSDRASANFQEEVQALVVAAEEALADNEIDEEERTDLAERIATLVAALDTPETLDGLDVEQLGAVAEDLSEVRKTLASHHDDEGESAGGLFFLIDTGESADGLSFLIVSVAEAVVSEATGACADADTRDGVEACRSAFHAGTAACAELGDAVEQCGDTIEQAKDDAEQRYEARKHDAESAAGCDDVGALDVELGAGCAEIVAGVVAACDGDAFADCRAAFDDAKDACEALGEFAYHGCKNAAEAVKNAADTDGDEDEESDVGQLSTLSVDDGVSELTDAFESAQTCAELPNAAIAAGCQSAIATLTEACSKVRDAAERDACLSAFRDVLDAFHDGKQACDGFGAASEACKDALERIKDTAEHDVKDAEERYYEELKRSAEQARSCSEVEAIDAAAGAACAEVAAGVASACELADKTSCREAFAAAKEACKALGVLAAEGCKSEIEAAKDAADESDREGD